MLHEWAAQWSAAGGPPEAVELVERLGAPDRAGPRRRVLVVTMDVLAPSMAGPAIRATAIATALAREHDVRLVTTSRCELERPDLDVRGVSDAALEGLVGWADVVILQGWVMVGRPWIASSSCVVVVDAYDPMHLEQLEQGRDAGGTRGRVEAVRGATATLNEQLRRADLVLCASDKQRDLWLGALATLGRVNPVTYDVDPSMGHLIAVVPFGVPDEPFPDGAGALKGVVPGIGVDDHVLLWGGGVYNWFDPLTLVQAVDALRHRVPTVRLYFMGMQHPNPGVAPMQMASDLRRLSDERGLTDRPRLLQRRMGGVRGSRRLPARRGHRRQHAPRPRGDRLLVPHAPPRLPLGRPADRRHAGRLVRASDRRATARVAPSMRRTSPGSKRRWRRSCSIRPGPLTPRRRADDWARSSPGRTTCSPSSRSASVLAGRPTSPAPRWKPTPATRGSRSAGGGTSGPCTSTSATVAPGSCGVVPRAGCAAAGPSCGTVSLRPCPR